MDSSQQMYLILIDNRTVHLQILNLTIKRMLRMSHSFNYPQVRLIYVKKTKAKDITAVVGYLVLNISLTLTSFSQCYRH